VRAPRLDEILDRKRPQSPRWIVCSSFVDRPVDWPLKRQVDI
jgi:hypothetical protein